MTRATLDGKNPNGWFPEQKLTVAEAVEAYTMGSAYAEFQEKEKGSITPGKLADMVLLSDDIFTIDPVKIRDVKVLTTWVGGKIVWDAGEESRALFFIVPQALPIFHIALGGFPHRQRILHRPGCTNGHLVTSPMAA